MRNRATLALMEQMIMILVFALSAAMCLQIFVTADQISRRSEARDRAVILVQCAAEKIRYRKGNVTAALGGDQVGYDENWQPCAVADAVYLLTAVREECDVPGLGRAVVCLSGEETLFTLSVSWQEGNDGT